VPESATRQVGLTNGQYALLPNIDAATALQLKGKPNVKLAETLELAYTLIGMNVSKPPFDNPKVREAVNYAINRTRSWTRRSSAPACRAARSRRRSSPGRSM
jgi:peptide/nickel transport system substrate-binding protein